MSGKEVKFEVIEIEDIPTRRYTKGSKYDPIINAFIERNISLSQLKVTKDDSAELLDGNYLRTQLNKRIVALELEDVISVTVINSVCYMKRL